MKQTGGQHNYAGDAMGGTAERFASHQQSSEPRIRILECESRKHQCCKTRQQDHVLPALLAGHSNDRADLGAALRQRLLAPDQQIVDEHSADDYADPLERD